ncbi:MAG: tRNA preQ1(34) S-adenosylmethionine ribosyltransferase-isomerase QueA [Bacteriovoracaceae bacterium]|jgi:S-adenosylmethionine:tRNA ribosyltransferase-isomerase|nr:tRNA preQ1(34) S-adenosylmethionine ribosyltransferase-isomerase QueA [Bacteriovoracaceae bacterium]
MKNIDLLTESYHYELDPKFIADRPTKHRHDSKLMVYYEQDDHIEHVLFKDLPRFLEPEHLLVLNQSKVFPCRLLGQKVSGGKAELFLLSLIANNGLYPAMIKASGKKNIGDRLLFGDLEATITKRNSHGEFFVSFNKSHSELTELLHTQAHIPIPPYIRSGQADKKDMTDYQTVYAKELGSVAAPTAGLHFTESVFSELESKGIQKAFVTLHVGAGTFKPVKSDHILEHTMHEECFYIDPKNLSLLNANSKRIAVGTTSLRVLESCASQERIIFESSEGMKTTDIFLYPGKKIESISGLITNFHLPKSTLLMLVSSLIGREKTLELYEVAKKMNYRFFSYGDAMLILRKK